MGRRLIIKLLIIISLIVAFSACDTSLVEDVKNKIKTDLIAAGDISSFKIIYESSGTNIGEAPVDENIYIEGDTTVIVGNINGLIKPGYSFTGWNTTIDGIGTSYIEDDTITIASTDIRLYAQWSPDVFSITFDKNDADAAGIMNKQDLAFETTAPLSNCCFTKTGWTFMGWAVTPSGNVAYSDGDSYTMGNSDLTLYAIWYEGYSVTFNKNDDDATGEMEMQLMPTGTTTALDSCTFEKKGWIFTGWSLEDDGVLKYSDSEYITIGAPVFLFAKWSANDYTVTFDKREGTGGSDSVTATFDSAMPNAGAPPSRAGYSFSGYYTGTGGGGTPYYTASMTSARVWDIASDTILYAYWQPVAYDITYELNGGTNDADNPASFTVESEIITLKNPTCSGYTFEGWFGNASFTGDQITNIPVGTIDNKDLYAKWTIINYSITYHLNEGTNTPENPTNYTVETEMITLKNPTRSGYTFGGWFGNASFTGDQITNIPVGTIDNKDLYAEWIVNSYIVVLDKQGGSGEPNDVNAFFGDPMPHAELPWRDGFYFEGYFEFPDGGGRQYYDQNMQNMINWDQPNNATLYAYWIPIPYMVILDKQGGTGGPYDVFAFFGEPMPYAEIPWREGFDFEGYFGLPDGQDIQYYDQNMQSMTNWDQLDNATIFAFWIPIEYTITLDKQGGTGGPYDVNAFLGDPMPYAEAPLHNYYIFEGYFEFENGQGRQYYDQNMQSMNSWDQSTDATLYAYWATILSHIIFDKGVEWIPDGSTFDLFLETGQELQPIQPPENNTFGQQFMGYFTKSDGMGEMYWNDWGDPEKVQWDITDQDVILFAWWD